MTETHVIDDELLLSYAAGAVEEPVAVLVATHLALNPAARGRYRRLEALGGAMIEEIEPEPLAQGTLDAVLACLGQQERVPARPSPSPAKFGEDQSLIPKPLIPRPLRDYIGDDPAKLLWKPTMRGVAMVDVPIGSAGGFTTRLMRVEGGCAVPQHTHRGAELVLVLDGGFTDLNGHFVRGDACVGDEALDHRPIADPGVACLSLLVSDGPIHLTGPFSWLTNRLNRY